MLRGAVKALGGVAERRFHSVCRREGRKRLRRPVGTRPARDEAELVWDRRSLFNVASDQD